MPRASVMAIPKIRLPTWLGAADGLRRAPDRKFEKMFDTPRAAPAIPRVAIPAPIIHTVFEHGAFTRADTLAVAPTVLAFASGLPAFSLSKVFQPGFYAREDTGTPMRFAIISVVVNIAASLILSRWLGHVGIALATSLAAWVNAILLGFTLSRRGLFSLDETSRQRLPRILASAIVMGGLLLAGSWLLRANYAEQAGFLAAAWGLLLLVTGGALSYFVVAHLSGAMRLAEIKTMLKR